ncbi:MAG: CvpA family protein, partial [Thermoguttaceae bacterium]
MSFILPILLLLIPVACVAFLYPQGMWANAIRLVNVVTGALLASTLFEPAAQWLDSWNPHYTYLWDFLCLWGLFTVIVVLFRAATDWISQVNVRFLMIADRIGSGVLAFCVGWVLLCFTVMTLHTAPLAKKFLFEGFEPGKPMVLGMSPDVQWLSFVHWTSTGVFCHSATPEEFDP